MTGAVTLIQRFGWSANLNIHLHCLVLDGVYLKRDRAAVFHEAAAPSTDELVTVLLKVRSQLATSPEITFVPLRLSGV